MTEPAKSPELVTLQRWMSELVRHPQGATAAARTKRAHALVPTGAAIRGAVVKPNDRMQPMQRVDVYNDGYIARLVDVLRSDFPGLIHAVGDAGFYELGAAYIRAHPSHNPNLIPFCQRLAEFVGKRRHLQHRAFLRDLGRLEVAMTDAFHAPEFDTLDTTELAHLTPEQWQSVVLALNPSVRLLKTSYPVGRYLQAVFDDAAPEIPARQSAYLAVYRKDYQVWRSQLSANAFATLSALQDGATFGEALTHAGDEAALVGAWFQDWSADGLFASATL